MQPIDQLSYIVPTLTALVDRIEPTQLNDPTPCAEFTVHDVLDHMIVGGGSFAYSFRGEQAAGDQGTARVRACSGRRVPRRRWTICSTP